MVISLAFFACRQLPSRTSEEVGRLRCDSTAFWTAKIEASERLDDEVRHSLAELHGQLDALVQRQNAAAGR